MFINWILWSRDTGHDTDTLATLALVTSVGVSRWQSVSVDTCPTPNTDAMKD